EASRGFAQVFSTKADWNEVSDELGARFEISFNTYKPFACGIVIHPSIDGCIRLRERHGLRASDIERINLRVHPLVLELTGKTSPTSGLEGKFSVYHCCAAGLIFGRAGEAEYSDDIVNNKELIELRQKIEATVDTNINEASADITITCTDGRVLHEYVEHAIGSLERPMSDSQLNDKFESLVSPVLGTSKT